MRKGGRLQVGPEVIIGVQKQAEDVRQQLSALQQEAGGLAQQVAPALAAFLAAREAPPHEDKVALCSFFHLCVAIPVGCRESLSSCCSLDQLVLRPQVCERLCLHCLRLVADAKAAQATECNVSGSALMKTVGSSAVPKTLPIHSACNCTSPYLSVYVPAVC